MVRTDTKRFRKAFGQWQEAVISHLKKYGANFVIDSAGTREWFIQTPAGSLRVALHSDVPEIFQRFNDIENGKTFTDLSWCPSCNPYSGKWNFGYNNEDVLNDPVGCLAQWKHCIDSLMSIPFAKTFSERLEEWLAGK